jgi:hypothetical protein
MGRRNIALQCETSAVGRIARSVGTVVNTLLSENRFNPQMSGADERLVNSSGRIAEARTASGGIGHRCESRTTNTS